MRSFLLAFEPGQVVAGTVSAVHNFGVFVHVDGEPDGLCTGFIRVPDLTWGWSNHPSEAVEVGQRITAEAIIAETRSGQVTLSLKANQVGRVLPGPITKIVPFSVFVQLAPDVEGFLHRSVIAAATLSTEAGALGPLWASGLLVAVALLIAFPVLTAITADRSTEVFR